MADQSTPGRAIHYPMPGIGGPSQRIVDQYQERIGDLDTALADAATSRRTAQMWREDLARIEATILLAGVEGRNETERKAALLVTLDADTDYQLVRERLAEAVTAQTDAERRADVAREWCRLLRGALAVIAGGAL